MNARISRFREALLLPLLLVVGCNVSDSRDEIVPEPGTVLLVPRIVAANGELPRTDSVQIQLEVGGSAFKDTALIWSASSLRLQGIKYGMSWKLTARGFLNPTGSRRWIVWSGSDTGTMSEQTKSTKVDRTKIANIVVTKLLATPAMSLNGGNVPGALVVGTALTINADGAKSVAWSTDGKTPACNPTSVADSVVVLFDSAKTDSITLKVVSCKDSSASPVDSVKFKVVARTANTVLAPTPNRVFPDTLQSGDGLRFQADSGAKIVLTLDSTVPKCADAKFDTASVVYDSAKGGKSVTIRAISCKGTTYSDEWTKTFLMRAKGVLAAPTLVGDQNLALTVGTGFQIAPALGAMVSHTTDKSKALTCAGATLLQDTATISVADISMGDSLVVRAVSCKDGVTSTEFRRAFFIPVPMPSIETKGGTVVLGTMKVGDTIVFKAYKGTKVAFTTNDSLPKCTTASMNTANYTIGSELENKTLKLKAVSCKDSVVGSSVKSANVSVVPANTVILEVKIPGGFDTSSTAIAPKAPWDSSLSLIIPTGTTLRWKLAVDTGKIDTSDWSTLGVPGASASTGTNVVVPRSLLATIPATDSLATVIAVAVLDSGKTPKDTVYLRWTIRVPVVPTPNVSVTRSEGKVSFHWTNAEKTGYQAWYKLGSVSETTATIKPGILDTVSLSVSSGQKVSLRVVATDSATGRSIETKIDTVALRPPLKPGFTVTNTDLTNGTVVVSLDSTTRRDSGSTWSVSCKIGLAGSPTSGEIGVSSGTWSGKLNQGAWTCVVTATRDGLMRDSSRSVSVSNTGPKIPDPVSQITLSRRDSSSLVWKWTPTAKGDSVLVYKSVGMRITKEALASLKPDTTIADSVVQTGLKPGDSTMIAVVVLPNKNAPGGKSEPVFSSFLNTSRPPRAPAFSVLVLDQTQGVFRVTISNYDPTCAYRWKISPSGTWDTIKVVDIQAGAFQRTVDSTRTITPTLSAMRDGYTYDSVSTALLVKRTSLYTPDPPDGLSIVRGNEGIMLRWSGQAGYQYRVFYTTTSGQPLEAKDTTDNSIERDDLRIDEDSLYLGFGSDITLPYRFAVQTVYAPDSTKGPSKLTTANSSAIELPLDSVRFFDASYCQGRFCLVWDAVENAVGYDVTVVGDTTHHLGAAGCGVSCFDTIPIPSKISGREDDTLRIVAVNSSGKSYTGPNVAVVHVPQLRSAPKTTWNAWIAMNNVYVSAKTDDNLSVYPSVHYALRKRSGADTINWRAITLNDNAKGWFIGNSLPTNGMIEYMLVYNFKWSGGAQAGDSTKLDTLKDANGSIIYLRRMGPPPIPQGYAEIKQGKHYLTLTSLGRDTVGMSPRRLMLKLYRVDTYDSALIDLSKGAISLEYPLGLKSIQAVWVYGMDVSGWSENSLLARDSMIKVKTAWGETIYYKTAVVGGRSWMLEPHDSGRGSTWLKATGLPSVPTVLGDVSPRQGICPDGWQVPTKSEFQAFFTALKPGVNTLDDKTLEPEFIAIGETMGGNPQQAHVATVEVSGRSGMYTLGFVRGTKGEIYWNPDPGSGYAQGAYHVYCIKAP